MTKEEYNNIIKFLPEELYQLAKKINNGEIILKFGEDNSDLKKIETLVKYNKRYRKKEVI